MYVVKYYLLMFSNVIFSTPSSGTRSLTATKIIQHKKMKYNILKIQFLLHRPPSVFPFPMMFTRKCLLSLRVLKLQFINYVFLFSPTLPIQFSSPNSSDLTRVRPHDLSNLSVPTKSFLMN